MAITFRCQHCGKKVEAPDSAGGKRGRCPYCKQSNYIPAPVSVDELFELAPEDGQPGGEHSKELREQERALAAELSRGGTGSVPLEHREDLKPEDLHHLVINYCLDMAGSELERAETHAAQLKKFPRLAKQAVEEFLDGSVLEPALDPVPTKLLHGFLNNLRDQLG